MTADPLLGRTVGPYRIETRLGEGGMGAVYLAVHETLQQKRAFKTLPASLVRENPAFVGRFLREARAAAGIDHANVVKVHDAGQSTAGEGGFPVHFIAQEYVRGVSLARFLKDRDVLPAVEAVSLILQAARGLSAAEEQNVIHRDIKPANLMITEKGVVKVADFGLAKNVETDTVLTQSGQIMGTPAYMSPEQADGRPVDARSDIYSLGVTFYELVTGVRPFNAPTPIALLRKHCDAPVPDPRQFRASLDDGICTILDKMLAKDPADRFPDHAALVAALETYLDERKDSGDDPEEGLQDSLIVYVEETLPEMKRAPAPPGPPPATPPAPSGIPETARPAAFPRWIVPVLAVGLFLVLGGVAVVAVLVAQGPGTGGTGASDTAGDTDEEGTGGETEAKAGFATPGAMAEAISEAIRNKDMNGFASACTVDFWTRETDGGTSLYREASREPFTFRVFNVQTSGDRAVVTARCESGGALVGGDEFLLASRHPEKGWLLAGITDDKKRIRSFLNLPVEKTVAQRLREMVAEMDRAIREKDEAAFSRRCTMDFWTREEDGGRAFYREAVRERFTLRAGAVHEGTLKAAVEAAIVIDGATADAVYFLCEEGGAGVWVAGAVTESEGRLRAFLGLDAGKK